MANKLKVSLIGLGRQNIKDNLSAIKLNNNIEIISVCDSNLEVLDNVSKELGVSGYDNAKELIKYECPDAVFIALPHNKHFDITKLCLEYGVNVFKEKPIAITYEEAVVLENISNKNNSIFYTTSQRRFSNLFNLAKEKLRKIGNIYSVDMNYTMHIKNLENSWRSNKNIAGGGVLIDMGYHYIDVLLWFFGFPDKVYSSISNGNLLEQNYNTEDTIKLIFEYDNKDFQHSVVSMNLSRTYPEKQENIVFLGTNGYMVLTKHSLKIYNKDNELIEEFYSDSNENIYSKQINYFVDLVINNKIHKHKDYLGSPANHLNHIKLINYIYQQNNR